MLIRAIKNAIKYSLNSAARLFGKQVFVVPGYMRKYTVFDFNMLSAYWHREQEIVAYETSLHRAGLAWSDSFSKRSRFYSLYQMANLALDRHCGKGDVAECGVWRSHSAHMIASLLKQRGFANKMLLFDSFQGLSGLTSHDYPERWSLNEKQVRVQREMLAASEETVRANLAEFDFVEYYAGWIPSRFPEVSDRQFILVHLDVDLYDPFRDSIEFFYPRLLEGGAMVFDDYGLTQFPGAKTAIDEAVASMKPSFFYKIPTGGAFLIK